jgi:gas vesicle protein
MSENPKKSNKGLITGLIVGGAITGVAGMLLSSEENREKTKEIGKKAGHAGLRFVHKLLARFHKEKPKNTKKEELQ